MKGAVVSKSHSKVQNSAVFSFLISFFLEPFKSGVFGFAAFFTVVILTKGVTYIWGINEEYVVDAEDVLFSLLGLIIVFVIKLIENIKHKTAN